MSLAPTTVAASPAVPMVVRWVLLCLVLLLLAVFAVRQSGPSAQPVDTPVVWKKNLRFEDGAKGEIVVRDAATEQQVAVFEGEQGFMRGTLRALARERKKRSIGPEAAFELSGLSDGQMVLHDPATGASIHLASFGPTNAQIYRPLQ